MKDAAVLDPLKVSAADFQRNIGRLQDIALRQPVAVTRNGRDSCVLISTEEYKRLKRRDRKVGLTVDLSDEWIEAVENARVPEEYAYLDAEMT